MADEKPSYLTSTLSQLAVASVGCYLLVAAYVAFVTKDLSSLKWAAEVFGAGYLAARQRGNGKAGANDVVAKPPTPV